MTRDQLLLVPEQVTVEWVTKVQHQLLESTKMGVSALKSLMPKHSAIAILERTERLVNLEPSLLEVVPCTPDTSVIVVGDTHGQYHDVCNMFEVAGRPSEERIFVLNGDFVDRGAWGNHETATCAIMYGFKGELEAKYGKSVYKPIFSMCKKLFASLPLAALVNRQTLVLHGGLFRKQPTRKSGTKKRKEPQSDCVLGSLADIRTSSKGGLDPSGLGASRLATDIQWSDPANEAGFAENVGRGIGMVFGPEITEQFLRENGLKLILRSHEGPDAREDREGMGNMLDGYTIDHVTASGKLMTVFSAPDYPQFMADDAQRYKNKGAVAILSAPDYSNPKMEQYNAVLPRPPATPYYDLQVNDSDEEFEPPGSTVSGMTDVREEAGMAAPTATKEVEGKSEEVVSQPAEKRCRISPSLTAPAAVGNGETASDSLVKAAHGARASPNAFPSSPLRL